MQMYNLCNSGLYQREPTAKILPYSIMLSANLTRFFSKASKSEVGLPSLHLLSLLSYCCGSMVKYFLSRKFNLCTLAFYSVVQYKFAALSWVYNKNTIV